MRIKLVACVSAVALISSPLAAQGILGGILDDGKITLGELLGLIFKTPKDATPKNSCQSLANAQSLVDGQIYGEGSQAEGSVCNGVKVKGLKGDEVDQWYSAFDASLTSGSDSGSVVTSIVDDKGRRKDVTTSWGLGDYAEVTEEVRVVEGVASYAGATEFPETSFFRVNVNSRLNLRRDVGAKDSSSVTGQYVGGDIVEVISFQRTTPDSCRSGKWALVAAKGVGVGYVCDNYLKTAPNGTSGKDVANYRPPAKGGNSLRFGTGQGNVKYNSFKQNGSKREAILTASVQGYKNDAPKGKPKVTNLAYTGDAKKTFRKR